MKALESLGVTKTGLVALKNNFEGNAFCESKGFEPRDDLVYRSKAIVETKRIVSGDKP